MTAKTSIGRAVEGGAGGSSDPSRDPEPRDVAGCLAVLLGARDAGAAHALLARLPLAVLSRASAAELEEALGLDPVPARRVAAACRLGRRIEAARAPRRPVVRGAEDVRRLLAPRVRGRRQEAFFALHLDGRHRVSAVVAVSRGTLTTSLVHPREVFGGALRSAAAALVVAHNHPSGDPEPSAEDLAVTRRLIAAGELLGVPLLDHVILGDGRALSLRADGRLASAWTAQPPGAR